MQLSDVQLQMLEEACIRLGKAGLARRLGITRQAIYDVMKRKSGLNPVTLLKIQEFLIEAKSKELPVNASGVATEPSHDISHSNAGLLRLLYQELPKLSETNLAKVYRYVVELQIKQESE